MGDPILFFIFYLCFKTDLQSIDLLFTYVVLFILHRQIRWQPKNTHLFFPLVGTCLLDVILYTWELPPTLLGLAPPPYMSHKEFKFLGLINTIH